jgi:hypothetical protein
METPVYYPDIKLRSIAFTTVSFAPESINAFYVGAVLLSNSLDWMTRQARNKIVSVQFSGT